jgi:hypothetical protein
MIRLILIYLCTVFAFLVRTSVSANANWVEFYPKDYLDTNSIELNEDRYISYWIKSLNNGSFQNINSKKVWYLMVYKIADCTEKKLATKAIISYDIDGNVIESSYLPDYRLFSMYNFEKVIPDTIGELELDFICKANKL